MAQVYRLDGQEIRVSNPQKVLFPAAGITKAEFVEYHALHGERLLRHVRDRAVTLRRYPDGVETEGWFQKHAPDQRPPWVATAVVPARSDGGPIRHFVLDGPATVVYLANLAAIELHVGLSTVAAFDRPVELVIDLDPPPDAAPSLVRRAAHRCRELFDELGLPAALKTSGSRGYHVHGPLDGLVEHDLVRQLARSIARVLAGRHPELLTDEFRRAKREGRVFVDWLRNAPNQTAVAPYSVRARPVAPIATPLAWEELATTEPQHWTIRSIGPRLATDDDPWAALRPADPFAIAEPLRAALRELGR